MHETFRSFFKIGQRYLAELTTYNRQGVPKTQRDPKGYRQCINVRLDSGSCGNSVWFDGSAPPPVLYLPPSPETAVDSWELSDDGSTLTLYELVPLDELKPAAKGTTTRLLLVYRRMPTLGVSL